MSELPKGVGPAREYAEQFAIEGALAHLIALAPPLGLPVVKNIVRWILENSIVDPTLDEVTAVAIAIKYAIDRRQFDSAFLKLKLMEHSASPDEIEAALVEAQKQMADFIRRGPVPK